MELFVTGHRPDYKASQGFWAMDHMVEVAKRALDELKPSLVYTGMALGWDTAVALACVELNIKFVAVVPFLGQESIWPAQSQRIYRELLEKADWTIISSSPGYENWKMHRRNGFLIRFGEQGLALYDETKSKGGTASCIREALKREKKMFNAWGMFAQGKESLTVIEAVKND